MKMNDHLYFSKVSMAVLNYIQADDVCERKRVCDLCGKAFRTHAQYCEHMKAAHKLVPSRQGGDAKLVDIV